MKSNLGHIALRPALVSENSHWKEQKLADSSLYSIQVLPKLSRSEREAVNLMVGSSSPRGVSCVLVRPFTSPTVLHTGSVAIEA